MNLSKETKGLIKKSLIDKRVLVNVLLNYEERIIYLNSKVKEYKNLIKEGKIENPLYLEVYIDKLEEAKVKKRTILEVLSPCEIVVNKEKYYLKYYVRFSKSEEYMFYNRINEKELFLYPKLKVRKRFLKKNKTKRYDIYSTQFLNKIYELINSGKYKIV